MIRARQFQAEHMARVESTTPPWKAQEPPAAPSFDEQYRAHMSELGAKGGKIGGKRRLTTLTDKRRREIAKKAAAARWSKGKAGGTGR